MRSETVPWVLGLSLLAPCVLSPAQAQTQNVPPTTADSTASGEERAGDIIVTARRVEERLQDVPISITVFNQQQLTNRNVINGEDLAKYTPSLSTNGMFGSQNTSFSIRGFVQELNTAPSVGVYFADVVAPRGAGPVTSGNGAGPGSFFDLQNVQVLKGPQGTLFGRNTTGGAILLVPQKPTGKLEGFIEGSYGNYGLKRIQGVINLPLSDAARLRLGVDHESRDGYVNNDSGIGPRRFNDIDYTSARVSLDVDLTPNLETYFIGSYSQSDTNGSLQGVFACNIANPLGFLSCGQLAQKGAGFYTAESDITDPYSKQKQWQLINTTTFRASDELTIKNIVSYAQIRSNLRADSFGTDWTIALPPAYGGTQHLFFTQTSPRSGGSLTDESTVTEELQFQGRSSDDRLTWQAGGYFEGSDPLSTLEGYSPTLLSCQNADTYQCTDLFGLLTGSPSGSYSISNTRFTYRDEGLYAQATHSITDRIKLTGGIRYTWDTSEATSARATGVFLQPDTPTFGCTIAPNNAPFTSLNQCSLSFREKSSAPTWLIDIDYKPSNDLLLYAKYARGYRQGSVNPDSAIGYTSFGPEHVDTYEAGVKTEFNGAIHGNFNATAFYNKFDSQQIQVGLQSSIDAASPTQGITNAGKSRIYGAEIESTISPFRGFALNASYAYLNTKLQSLTAPPLVAGSIYDILTFTSRAGDPLPFSPKNKVSSTASYTIPFDPAIGRVSVAATFTYTSRQLVTASSPFGYIQPTKLLNLNLNWASVAQLPVDLSIFATNVTNKKYYTYISGFYNTVGFESGQLGEPRMYGARLRYRFGK